MTSAGKYTREMLLEHIREQERAEHERSEAARKESARRAFLAAGGKPEDFEAEYKAQQNESVRQTVKRREEEARAAQRAISTI